jgi:hypothetical protein
MAHVYHHHGYHLVGIQYLSPIHQYVHVYVRTYVRTRVPLVHMVYVCHTYKCTYVRTYNVMSQLSDWKRAHIMCTENHVCFGRIHGSSQLREGANAGQHTPTLSLPPSHRTYSTIPMVPMVPPSGIEVLTMAMHIWRWVQWVGVLVD